MTNISQSETRTSEPLFSIFYLSSFWYVSKLGYLFAFLRCDVFGKFFPKPKDKAWFQEQQW